MSTKRIEQLIDEIYEYMENCKPVKFSNSKVAVQKEEMYDLLDELRLKVPDEIKRCQKMIANRDAIISDAENKAVEIENAAKARAQKLVSESEIMQQAFYQANELVQNANDQARAIMDEANFEANRIREASLEYTNDMLAELQDNLTSSYEVIRNRADAMLEAMQQNLETVIANRMELNGEAQPAQLADPVEDQPIEQEIEEEESYEEYEDDDYSTEDQE